MCLFALILTVLFLSTDALADSFRFSPYAFFKNSVRREPTTLEQETVVKLDSGCTAFFVKNTSNRTLMVTARHCTQYSITNWCKNGGSFTDTLGSVGKCTRVVAADVGRDIALFEGALPYTPQPSQGLELAGYAPATGTMLEMVGYPADKYRSAKLTTTHNCWITETNLTSPHGAKLVDTSSRHNCDTYGGNSGGPMIEEGTRIAVGLPFTYYPNNYHEYAPYERNAYMAQMSDFVSAHRAALVRAGVEIRNQQP